MLSAVQPSNRLTIGNYIGAVMNWAKMQADYDCLFFAVDLHVITDTRGSKELRRQTYQAIATYIACGLDPDLCTLFVQSHVKQHAELAWILTCHATMGEVSRMTQFKDKSQKHGESIPMGLFAYPVLMAADILLYQTDYVPVGIDQKQHVELTRDLAVRMNNAYTPKPEAPLFKIPEPMIPPLGAKIMSLQDPLKKMSKSDPDLLATLFLDDSDKDIEKKLKRAVTDSGSEILDADDKPGVRNLLTLQSVLTNRPIAEIVAGYAGKQYGHLKVDTAGICMDAIRPIREKTERLMGDLSYLDTILQKGAEKASERAAVTLARVADKMGFIPRS
ncbi:MAG: tryptophan--tRNA ligase [Cryobacterium sp.]|nr:tryptophan--tRNA ligase [Oligoflexia bacterium]